MKTVLIENRAETRIFSCKPQC